MMTKILCGKFEKSFLEWEKMASRKIFRHFLHANFFMFILLISNHPVFVVQFGIKKLRWDPLLWWRIIDRPILLLLFFFQKAKIELAEAARAISAFWKTQSLKNCIEVK